MSDVGKAMLRITAGAQSTAITCVSLDAAADVAQDGLDVAAEEDDGADAEDGDEAEDEAVLGQALTLFVDHDGTERCGHGRSPSKVLSDGRGDVIRRSREVGSADDDAGAGARARRKGLD